jgi:hypothetical protein
VGAPNVVILLIGLNVMVCNGATMELNLSLIVQRALALITKGDNMAKIGKFDVLVGADPEFWVRERGTSKVVSAHGLLKNNRVELNKGSINSDGLALEININPVKTIKGFNTNLNTMFDKLNMLLPYHEFVFDPVVEFGSFYLGTQPVDVIMFDGDPDYNAYTKSLNPPPNPFVDFRTAGGHIHISWKNEEDPNWPKEISPTDPTHFEACCMLAKTLDSYLGIPSLTWDRDTKRRTLFGKPGAFRPKVYGDGWFGMEYRVLSSAWLKLQSTRDLVYGNTIDAFNALLKDEELCEKTWYGNSAKTLLENPEDPNTKRNIINVLEGGAGIKGPKHYRLAREEGRY